MGVTIPDKDLTMRVSRSSGPGGQSVNMSDSRVQLSFQLDTAEWIPEAVRSKMKTLYKKRLTKKGEFSVACQITSSQLENRKLAVSMIEDLIKKAEEAVEKDEFESNKMSYKEYHIEK